MAQAKLQSQCVVAEMTRTLDLSDIIEKIDTYSPGDFARSDAFTLDDVIFEATVYPKGDGGTGAPKNQTNSIALYMEVIKFQRDSSRKIHVLMQHEAGHSSDFIRCISHFSKGGVGWRNVASHRDLKHNPIVQLHIKLIEDPLFVTKKNLQTFSQQHQNMHKLSKQYGDVTLMVKLLPQNHSDVYYSPPKKKRKLNETYQCEICQKQFDTNKALKSHQAHKGDQAHKEYYNENKNTINNNHNSHNMGLDIQCNEIRVSSVVLRSASKVFDRMLNTDMMEKQEKQIEIQAESIDDVRDLVYFMSTNNLRDDSNVIHIIVLAHYYEMDRLFWKCVYQLIKNVSVHNFAQTLNIFDKYKITEGYDSLVKFAKNNKDELQKADDFHTISHAFKCGILGF